VFNEKTLPGEYTNYAEVKAVGRHPSFNPFYGSFANSDIASTTVTVVASEAPVDENSDQIGDIEGEIVSEETALEDVNIGGSLEDLILPFATPLTAQQPSSEPQNEPVAVVSDPEDDEDILVIGVAQGPHIDGLGGILDIAYANAEVYSSGVSIAVASEHGAQTASVFGVLHDRPTLSLSWIILLLLLGSAPFVINKAITLRRDMQIS